MSSSHAWSPRLLGAFCSCALLLAGCGGGMVSQGGGGSDYPTGDIELVVPYEPGGGYDAWARTLAPYLEKHLPNDVSVVVENVPGAGGLSAANQMYAAEPDGTQIQILNLTGLAAAQLAGETEFKLRDFTYLGRITDDPQVLYVAGDSSIGNVNDLKAAAPIKQAMTGFSSSEGVNAAVLYDALKVKYTPVMHEGSDEATLSVIRGDTHAGIGSLESALEDLQSGDLKPILYMGKEKPKQGEPGYAEVKDTQTLAEIGRAELESGLQAQRVVAAPPGLPDDISQVLDQAIQDALNDPQFQREVEKQQLSPNPLNAEKATKLVNGTLEEISGYKSIVRKAIQQHQ